MFTIYSDNTLIYDDTSTDPSLKLISPKLSLAQSSAGSLTFTVPPGNAGYNSLDRLTSFIRVFKNTQSGPYWEGRILTEATDFWNCKQITCEGILGVLNDTIQPPNHYQNQTARSFLTALLDVHNAKVEAWKRIYVGVTDAQMTSSHRYTNYESTLECINDKLLSKEGGYIQIRNENGTRYLDYLTNYPQENTQKIEFGKNLLDFSKSFSSEDFCTVLVPRGAELGEGPYEALVPYVDVSSVNNGSIYVTLTNADFDTPPDVLPVDEFGWIEAVHDWEDVYLPQNLLTKAKQYLKDQQFDNMQLSVNAVDMRYAGAQYEQIDLNDSVRVVSAPHGLDRLFPVTKLDIPLDAPESTQFTLGTTVQVSLTHRDKKNISAVKNEIAQLPTKQSIVAEAKAQAATMIESAIEGYVTIIHNEETGSEELVISNTPDYRTATRIWRWNVNGLAFSDQGYNSGNYKLALTADGKINADLISTGTLLADLIKAGVLQDQVDGTRFYLNLATGELRIKMVSDLSTALSTEVTNRQNAISAEATARQNGDTAAASSAYNNAVSYTDTQLIAVNGDISSIITSVDNLSDSISETVQTAVEQTAEGLETRITRTENNLGTVTTNLTRFTFDSSGLEIRGTAGSDNAYLKLASDRVGLWAAGNERLWLTQTGANAENFNATKTVAVGDFIWEKYDGGFRLRK